MTLFFKELQLFLLSPKQYLFPKNIVREKIIKKIKTNDMEKLLNGEKIILPRNERHQITSIFIDETGRLKAEQLIAVKDAHWLLNQKAIQETEESIELQNFELKGGKHVI